VAAPLPVKDALLAASTLRTLLPVVIVSVDAVVFDVSSASWSEKTEYQHPSEFVASHGPPGVSPARTTFLWWLYCVDTAFEFASINVSRVWAEVAARGVDRETGEGATRNDVAAVPDASVDEPPRVATPPRALASDEPRELPIST